jgi:hypothetical protein
VWAYALAWFLLNDRIKLLAYRIFDPAKPVLSPGKIPPPKTHGVAGHQTVAAPPMRGGQPAG